MINGQPLRSGNDFAARLIHRDAGAGEDGGRAVRSAFLYAYRDAANVRRWGGVLGLRESEF